MSTSRSSETRTLPIDDVRPYWRNPRRISDEAVEGVKKSLEEFGYLQPIVVDAENTIIIGHTRYTALRRLGQHEVDVLVVDLPPAKSKQLRVIDNRTHEYGKWDFDKLDDELARLSDDPLVVELFPEAQAEDFSDDEETLVLELDTPAEEQPEPPVEFVCPSCFHEWETQVTRDQIMEGRIDSATA